MILLIDNYDSFTYNLYQYLGELGAEQTVFRNDKITLEKIAVLKPEAIVLSPGPCYPAEAGICVPLVKTFFRKIPILGVCLGHQAVCESLGAKIINAGLIFHGKPSAITHDGAGLFEKLSQPMTVGRYHSLIADPDTIPKELKITAQTNEGLIMGVQHKNYPLYGVQFHPESVLTPDGKKLLNNFLKIL